MRRGDIFAVAGRGDFSTRPRPALIVQADMFDPEHPTVTVCPMTSEMNNEAMYRLTIMPDENNGLRLPSQIQIDKTQAIWRHRFGEQIGKASPALMAEVDVALRRWLDL